MRHNYKFHNPAGVYLVSFVIEEWLDVFTKEDYVYTRASNNSGEKGIEE